MAGGERDGLAQPCSTLASWPVVLPEHNPALLQDQREKAVSWDGREVHEGAGRQAGPEGPMSCGL